VHVEEHEIGQVFRCVRDRFRAGCHSGDNDVTQAVQKIREQLARVIVVFGQQNSHYAGRFV
jgi:hypothetical protein